MALTQCGVGTHVLITNRELLAENAEAFESVVGHNNPDPTYTVPQPLVNN